MKKSSILIMILMMMAIQPGLAQQGKNLVRNGTFEKGNVGFKSDFRFSSKGALNGLLVKGGYNILDSFPHQADRFYNYFKFNHFKHDSVLMMQTGASTGNFLAANVNESGKIWYDSITIKPNTTYSFSCIVANVYYTPLLTSISSSTRFNYNEKPYNNLASPGVMKLCVNGEKVKTLDLKCSNEWKILRGKFTSGPDQTRIEISIQDRPWHESIWAHSVNYAAVDNIVFKEIKSAKEIPPVKKDTSSKIIAVSVDFNKDISIDQIKIDQKFQLRNIYFAQSKYMLLAASIPKLNELVTFMRKYPTVRIRLEGHTDNQGNPERNQELSENRAKEIKEYLVRHGIVENRMEWIGYGDQRPTNSNANEYLRSKNRRVEVVILGK
jgi:outer membrane protein OmpA-like peptidoglycan-associated protein